MTPQGFFDYGYSLAIESWGLSADHFPVWSGSVGPYSCTFGVVGDRDEGAFISQQRLFFTVDLQHREITAIRTPLAKGCSYEWQSEPTAEELVAIHLSK